MIKLSYEQIIEKIRDQTKKPFSEIEILVNKKLEQLSDFISKQGAAHIIANELKVKLFDKIEGRLKIKDLVSGMNSVEVLSKVIKIYGIREFEKDGKQGKVASILIGDETGTCRMTLWDTNHIGEIEKNNLMEEKVVLVKNAYVKENNGFKSELNNLILEDAINAGKLEIAIGLRTFGMQTRPINKVLEYTTDPYIPGVTGSESGAKKFLEELMFLR